MDEIVRETRQLIDQIRGEHEQERVLRALRQLTTTPPARPGPRLAGLEAAGAEPGPARSLKQVLQGPAATPQVAELQRLNDRLYLCGTLLRRDVRTLKSYPDFARLAGELRKALNTADDGEFVPDSFSTSLVEEIRLQRRLPGLFENVEIARSPLRWPVEGSIGLPYLVAENTNDTGARVPTRDPQTANVTFAAKTIGVRVPFSHEFDEDSIVAAEDYVRRQIAKALTDGLETAILNGDRDAAHMDAVVTAGNDVRRSFHGLRRLAQAPAPNTETDLATFNQAGFASVRRKMAAYGIDPGELVCLMGVKTYYRILGDSTNWGDFQTLDKIGPRAIAVTGEVGALYGVPVIVSAYAPETCSNVAECDGQGSDGVMVIANRRAYGLATQLGATIETLWDPEALQYKVIGYQRVDFQPWFNPVTELAVSVGYNIDLS